MSGDQVPEVSIENVTRGLAETIERSLDALLPTGNVIFTIVDPPNHANVGDSAILLGEIDALRRLRPSARLQFVQGEIYSDVTRRMMRGSDALLFHGGGNFGDLWPRHHQFRLRVIRDLPDMPMIQFPQSVSFSNEKAAAETIETLKLTTNFHFMVRDHVSLAYAQQAFAVSSQLVPDMAFAMNRLAAPAPSVDVYALLREDKEQLQDHDAIRDALNDAGKTFRSGDWLKEVRKGAIRLDDAYVKVGNLMPSLATPFNRLGLALRERAARQRLDRGLAQIASGSTVVTDRLHAHILSAMIGRRTLVLPSSDHKIRGLYESWSHQFPNVTLVEDTDGLSSLLVRD